MSDTKRHNWDGESHKDLLLATIDVMRPSGEQFRNIVERTTNMGYTFTVKAVTYCFYLPFSDIFYLGVIGVLLFASLSLRVRLILTPSSQHLQKLRRSTTEPGTTSTPATPKAPKTPSTPKSGRGGKAKTPGSKKDKRTKGASEEENNEMPDVESPSKKLRVDDSEDDFSVKKECVFPFLIRPHTQPGLTHVFLLGCSMTRRVCSKPHKQH